MMPRSSYSAATDDIIKFSRIAYRLDEPKLKDVANALMTYLIAQESFWKNETTNLPDELVEYYMLNNGHQSLRLKISEGDGEYHTTL